MRAAMKGFVDMNRLSLPLCVMIAALLIGCGNKEKEDRDFHTSGSREADQRAEQQVAKVQQLRGEGGDEAAAKKSLFARLGGEKGIDTIVDDGLNRAMSDPRVNVRRRGVMQG